MFWSSLAWRNDFRYFKCTSSTFRTLSLHFLQSLVRLIDKPLKNVRFWGVKIDLEFWWKILKCLPFGIRVPEKYSFTREERSAGNQDYQFDVYKHFQELEWRQNALTWSQTLKWKSDFRFSGSIFPKIWMLLLRPPDWHFGHWWLRATLSPKRIAHA